MHNNRYYIIDADDPNLDKIIGVCVGPIEEQRYNIAKTKIVIKMCAGDVSDYPFLKDYENYNHKQILIALDNDEWREPNFNP